MGYLLFAGFVTLLWFLMSEPKSKTQSDKTEQQSITNHERILQLNKECNYLSEIIRLKDWVDVKEELTKKQALIDEMKKIIELDKKLRK